jgi:hypothetical protein
MREKILERARLKFGQRRFEEIMGELWLQSGRLEARVVAGGRLDAVLAEWEGRFRRDVEEGRHQEGGARQRDMRFSEYDSKGDLTEHVERSF